MAVFLVTVKMYLKYRLSGFIGSLFGLLVSLFINVLLPENKLVKISRKSHTHRTSSRT